jgi:membrane-bound inhibitor of C-type lysozyme
MLSACKEAPKNENSEPTTNDIVKSNTDDIVTTSSIDKNGEKLDISFNNTKGTATLTFKGETIDLVQEKAASGIWYKNDTYELRGKGEHLELKKDGETLFKS